MPQIALKAVVCRQLQEFIGTGIRLLPALLSDDLPFLSTGKQVCHTVK